jgi:hypothetical protein
MGRDVTKFVPAHAFPLMERRLESSAH